MKTRRSGDCAYNAAFEDVPVDNLVASALSTHGASAHARLRQCVGAMLDASTLAALSRLSPDALRAHGLGPRSSVRLAAIFELGRRVERARIPAGCRIDAPARVFELMASELRGLAQETFHVLLLDGKHRLRRRQRVSVGTLTSSLVHPREVFGVALRESAAAVIAVHNHPSGDPEPSREDVAVTRRLIDAGRLLGVPLLDHVVVADGGYVSLRDRIDFDASSAARSMADAEPCTAIATAASAAVSMRKT